MHFFICVIHTFKDKTKKNTLLNLPNAFIDSNRVSMIEERGGRKSRVRNSVAGDEATITKYTRKCAFISVSKMEILVLLNFSKMLHYLSTLAQRFFFVVFVMFFSFFMSLTKIKTSF